MVDARAARPKVYSGNRGRHSNSVEVRERRSTRTRPLELRLDLFNHSSTGFEWAMAAPARRNWIADHLGDDAPAVCRHQVFQMVGRREAR